MIKQKTVLTAVFCLIIAVLPLVVIVALADDTLEGLGLGFVVTGVWVLLLALTVQFSRHRREQRRAQEFPGPAGRRHDATGVAEAMVALAPADWTGLRLEVDDDGRRMTVHPGRRCAGTDRDRLPRARRRHRPTRRLDPPHPGPAPPPGARGLARRHRPRHRRVRTLDPVVIRQKPSLSEGFCMIVKRV